MAGIPHLPTTDAGAGLRPADNFRRACYAQQPPDGPGRAEGATELIVLLDATFSPGHDVKRVLWEAHGADVRQRSFPGPSKPHSGAPECSTGLPQRAAAAVPSPSS